jgi:hypothetical protein
MPWYNWSIVEPDVNAQSINQHFVQLKEMEEDDYTNVQRGECTS